MPRAPMKRNHEGLVKPESATSGRATPATIQASRRASATTKSSKTLRLQRATAAVSVARNRIPEASSGGGGGRYQTMAPAASAGRAEDQRRRTTPQRARSM